MNSFIIGIVTFRIIDRTLPHANPELLKKEKPSIERSVTMLVIGMALHNRPEGLAIEVGFALTPALGMVIALGDCSAGRAREYRNNRSFIRLNEKANEIICYSHSDNRV
jgi:hypothetical protein